MRKFFPDFVIVCLAIVLSYLAVCLSIPAIYTPANNYGAFKGIRPDKWLADGAEVRLPSLLSRGNFINIKFENWFPEGLAKPQAQVKVCNQLASDFFAEKGGQQKIYLTGDCEPRLLKFKIINPFSLNRSDVRKLGLRIQSMELSSRIGIPLASLFEAAPVVLAVLATIIFLRLALSPKVARFAAILLIAVLLFLVPQNLHDNFVSMLGWIIIAVAVSFGLILGKNIDFSAIPLSIHKDKNFRIVLIFIVALAAIIRFYGLDFGLPFNYHPDEVPKFNAIMRMREAGDLNPRYFLHPSLLLYSTYGMNSLLRVVFDLGANWSDSLLFSGRVVSATAGTLSVALCGLIAFTIWGRLAGLLAALFLSFAPLHVTVSRYVKEDALLTFFVLLSVYLLVQAVRKDKPWLLLIAGFVAGLSAGVKYTGAVTGSLILLSPWLKSGNIKPDIRYLKFAIRAMFFVPLGFLISTPYALLDLDTFLRGFSYEKNHMQEGHGGVIDAWSQLWMYHFVRSILPGFQTIPLLIALLGIGAFLRRNYYWGWFIICALMIFYLPAEFVKAKPAPQPERYIVPCLPFLSIAAAALLARFFAISRGVDRYILILLILLSPAFSVFRSVTLASEIKTDTRDIMRNWIEKNIPAGSHILVDWKAYAPVLDDLNLKVEYLPQEEIIPSLGIKKLRQSGAAYLLSSSLFYNRFLQQPDVPEVLRQHILGLSKDLDQVVRISPQYGTYGFHNPILILYRLK